MYFLKRNFDFFLPKSPQYLNCKIQYPTIKHKLGPINQIIINNYIVYIKLKKKDIELEINIKLKFYDIT